MPYSIGNPYLEAFLLGKESGAEETRNQILDLLKSRIHASTCDCYECVELRLVSKLIEGSQNVAEEME